MAALTIIPRHVLGGPRYTAPSDQLTKGIIGVGSMGRGHYGYAGTRLVAICDVDKNHLEAGQQLAGEKLAMYSDYRKLIADPNVDIVHIATPPHWHGIMAVDAARAGKDIWCEKPMTPHHWRRETCHGGNQTERQHLPAEHVVPLYRYVLRHEHNGRQDQKVGRQRHAGMAVEGNDLQTHGI